MDAIGIVLISGHIQVIITDDSGKPVASGTLSHDVSTRVACEVLGLLPQCKCGLDLTRSEIRRGKGICHLCDPMDAQLGANEGGERP